MEPEIEQELDLELELDGTEDVETLKGQLAKKDEIIRQQNARLKQAKEKPQQTQIITKPSEIEDERLELRLQGYSKDDVNFIMNNGGAKVLEDNTSLVAIALNTKKEQKRAEEAASQTEQSSTLSEIERKYTEEQMRNMSVEELGKLLPHVN
jgi:hypothetical protein